MHAFACGCTKQPDVQYCYGSLRLHVPASKCTVLRTCTILPHLCEFNFQSGVLGCLWAPWAGVYFQRVPVGCLIVDYKSRPSHPSRPPPAALSANAYLSAFGGCTGLSSSWKSHDIAGDETRLSSSWIRRAITRRKSTLNFVGDAIGRRLLRVARFRAY